MVLVSHAFVCSFKINVFSRDFYFDLFVVLIAKSLNSAQRLGFHSMTHVDVVC